jgi:hypothetical protein
MDTFKGVLQLVLASICLIIAGATLVNMLLIVMRPETVSVANSMIGQLVLIVCFLAGAQILGKRGLARLRRERIR